jgi:hypothetical protein
VTASSSRSDRDRTSLLKRDLSDTPDAAARVGGSMCAAAIAATLASAGWSLHNRVGRPVSLRNGEQRLSPFKDFSALAQGELSVEALAERLAEAGVAGLPVRS